MATSLSHLKQWNPEISKILNKGAGRWQRIEAYVGMEVTQGTLSLFLCHEPAVTQIASVLSAWLPQRGQHGAEPQLTHNGCVT